MSQPRCPYCGSTDGCITTTSPVSPSPLFVKECKSCGRIVEEYCSNVQDMFVERAEDTPLCIVTPDFSNNEEYCTPPIEDDPYENIGFITAFSTWSMELAPLYTSTTSSFSGYLAELERVLLNPVSSTSGGVAATTTASIGHNGSMVDNLRAYFQILEVSSLLGLDRDISDHAVQLFRDCSSTACMRNRNAEALATAALVQASREAKEARTLQEISTAANVSQKEIHRYMKILTDALKLSQPIDSNSISVYMPRFCSILDLDKSTQDLATYIGEVVMNKSFCTRRNPISISAAAIYLSCQLEDKRKTQTEICKATALTEVTLRKVYKELLENIDDLLPANYTPAVPLAKAFPVSGSSVSRAPGSRGAGLGSCIQPLSAISSAKPDGVMNSTNFPHVNSGGKDVNTALRSPAASVAERLSLFGSSNDNSKFCIKKSTMVSNGETSRLVATPSSTAAARASLVSGTTSVAKNTLLDTAGLRWDTNSEAFSGTAASNASTMQHKFKSFRHFFQDTFPSSVASGAMSSPPTPQAAVNSSSSSVFDPSSLHPGEISRVPMRDEPSTLPLQCDGVANKELVKGSVHDSLTLDRGWVQDDVDNRGAANCLVSECSIKTSATTTSSSQRLHKGVWDLNLADSAPQECVLSPNLTTQAEVGGRGLPKEKLGISGSDWARHEVVPVNSSFLGARNLNLEPLTLTAAALGAQCNTVQQASHASFWQPSLHVSASSANSVSTSGDKNTTVSGISSKVTAMVDNCLHSEELNLKKSGFRSGRKGKVQLGYGFFGRVMRQEAWCKNYREIIATHMMGLLLWVKSTKRRVKMNL